jgi:hypothetical protein
MFQILTVTDPLINPEETQIIRGTIDGGREKRIMIKGDRHVVLLLDKDHMVWLRTAMNAQQQKSQNTKFFNPNDPVGKKQIEEINQCYNDLLKAYDVMNTE